MPTPSETGPSPDWEYRLACLAGFPHPSNPLPLPPLPPLILEPEPEPAHPAPEPAPQPLPRRQPSLAPPDLDPYELRPWRWMLAQFCLIQQRMGYRVGWIYFKLRELRPPLAIWEDFYIATGDRNSWVSARKVYAEVGERQGIPPDWWINELQMGRVAPLDTPSPQPPP